MFCSLIELIYSVSVTFTNAVRKFIFVRLPLLSAGEETELVIQTGHFLRTYNRVFFCMICVNFGSLSFKNKQQAGLHVHFVAGSVPEHSGESEVKESMTVTFQGL